MTTDDRDSTQATKRVPHHMPEFPELPEGLTVFGGGPMNMADEWLITEPEIARQLRMSLKEYLAIVRIAEDAGLPVKDPIFGRRNRRAVERWINARHGVLDDHRGNAVPTVSGRGQF